MRFAGLLLLSFGLACSSSTPPQPTTAEPEPQARPLSLDGRALYPRPLAAAPESVRTGWSTYQQAWASEPPMPDNVTDAEAYRRFTADEFVPYVNEQLEAAMGLLGALEGASDPEVELVLSVLAGRLLQRSAGWLWNLPLPDASLVDADARARLQQTIHETAQKLAVFAQRAYAKCVEAVGAEPARQPWGADCAGQSEALDPIRTAQIGPPPTTPMPESCEDHRDPLYAAPAHDPEARPQLLVLVEASSDDVDTDEVRREVERWARREHDLRAVPEGRRRAAERLVEQGKVRRSGPVCAAAPSLSWVLGTQVRHLVVAHVSQDCAEGVRLDPETLQPTGPPEMLCHVTTSWRRAGTLNDEGLPTNRHLNVEVTPDTAAVVGAVTSDQSAILGALAGSVHSEPPPRMVLAEVETDPGYRLHAAFEALELGACQTERGASELSLSWTVTPRGAVEDVRVEGGDEAVRACVQEKLATLALPCTPDGEPIAMSTHACLAR